jgi:hypothetical protein
MASFERRAWLRPGPVTAAGLLLLAAVTLGPLLGERLPIRLLDAYPSLGSTFIAYAMVLGLMLLTLVVRAWLDGRDDRHTLPVDLLLACVAAGLTLIHLEVVERSWEVVNWQIDKYLSILNHQGDAPHRYRTLPYGFARLLERVTRDWIFSCVAYRWFFTWWFLWASYRLARHYHPLERSLFVVALVAAYYPLSILHYWGQLTDPLSHFLFVLSLIYLLEDRPWPLAASLALGVVAKETAILIVPTYYACYWRNGLRAVRVTAGLGVAGVAAFLAVRLHQGWQPELENVNGLSALMIGTNLGIGEPIAYGAASVEVGYLHVLLFLGPFAVLLGYRWREIDPRLRTACAVLTPLLLVSNVCFGWLYESRNYLPLVPLLATAVLPAKQVQPPRM